MKQKAIRLAIELGNAREKARLAEEKKQRAKKRGRKLSKATLRDIAHAKRLAREAAERTAAEQRSIAAQKGWETRRMNTINAQFAERTKREKAINKKRRNLDGVSHLPVESFPGVIKVDINSLSHAGIVAFVHELRSLGVNAFRFQRQVPPTPSYPKGLQSTEWLNWKKSSDKWISNFIGSMMQPGIDFVRAMYIFENDVAKLPNPIRDQMIAAIRRRA